MALAVLADLAWALASATNSAGISLVASKACRVRRARCLCVIGSESILLFRLGRSLASAASSPGV